MRMSSSGSYKVFARERASGRLKHAHPTALSLAHVQLGLLALGKLLYIDPHVLP